MHVFPSLTEAEELTESSMMEYKHDSPQYSLEDLTPWDLLAKHERAKDSNQRCN
jgi:putative transposase